MNLHLKTMNTTRFCRNLMLAACAGALTMSCTDKEETQLQAENEITVSARIANTEGEEGARVSNLVYGNFEISDIKVSMDNVKLNLRGTTDDSKKPSIVHIRQNSSVILTLIEDGVIYEPIIGAAMAYDGVYGKLNFDLVKATDLPEEDEMQGLSVLAKATWFDVPAIVYLDLEDEVNIQFNQGIEVTGSQDFYLTLYLDKFLEGVDPNLVSDGNGDGLVEVGPNNEDGNGEAYDLITANMEEAMQFKNGEFK